MSPRVLVRIMEMPVALVRALFSNRADLAIENLALRQQVAALKRERPRPPLDDLDRALWVALKEKWTGWMDSLILVSPETVVRWHKESFKKHWGRISRSGPGRPLISVEIRSLVRRMAVEHDWGAPRIHAELLKLGFDVSQATVSRHLPKRPASPDKVERWKRFLRNHLPDMAAMDFFTIPTASFKVLYGLVVIHHDRRRILHVNVTENPTAQWVIQQLREAFPFTPSARYLIHDRDTKFSAAVRGWIKVLGLRSVQTAFRAPWQNGICERWIGSLRRELFDHVVIFNESHVRRLVGEYVRYHQIDRCHLSLDKDAPERRPVQQRPPGDARVIAFPRVGGIHHRYEWKQAA